MSAATLNDSHVTAWRDWRHRQARLSLARLDPEAERFAFQVFDDTTAKRRELARVVHGAFDSTAAALDGLQECRAGVFVTINTTDGTGRQAHNIKRVRAVFVDLDGAPLATVLAAGLDPHIVCESSPGRYHAYWLTDDCPLAEFERMQRALARRFGGDPSVHDLPRVMRLPGFRHFKGEAQTCELLDGVGTSAPPYTLAEIVGTLGLELDAPDDRPQARPNGDGGKIAPGNRHAHLFALGRSMARRGTPDAVRAALAAENSARCDPPLPDAELDYLASRAFDAKHAQGWQDQGRREATRTDDATHATGEENSAAGDEGPPPIDVLRPLAAPPLRADDVPEVLARFAEAHARATGFDVSILLAGGIVAAAAMLSDDVRLCVSTRSSWFESARLWVVSIGGPGCGKTPGLKTTLAPVFALHRELLAQWVKEHGEADDPPPKPALYTSDATTEALADVLRDNERGLLYFVDELESWLASHDAYRNGAGRDRGEWLRLYDGGPHQVNRVRRGSFFVPNWGASLLSATTPAALRKLAPKLPDDGLLQRLLLVLARPRELPDATMLRVETQHPTEAWDAALRRLYAIPAAVVHLSGDARAAFEAEQTELHRLTLTFEDLHPPFAAHLAKRTGMLARLALAFHALDAPAITADVSGDTMARAVRFLRRQERHAQAVYSTLLGADTGMSLAKAIARSILASGLQTFNRRELTPRCKAFRGADEQTRVAALSLLSDCGWLTCTANTLSHGTLWDVDKRVHTLFSEHGAAAREQRAAVRSRLRGDDDA